MKRLILAILSIPAVCFAQGTSSTQPLDLSKFYEAVKILGAAIDHLSALISVAIALIVLVLCVNVYIWFQMRKQISAIGK